MIDLLLLITLSLGLILEQLTIESDNRILESDDRPVACYYIIIGSDIRTVDHGLIIEPLSLMIDLLLLITLSLGLILEQLTIESDNRILESDDRPVASYNIIIGSDIRTVDH